MFAVNLSKKLRQEDIKEMYEYWFITKCKDYIDDGLTNRTVIITGVLTREEIDEIDENAEIMYRITFDDGTSGSAYLNELYECVWDGNHDDAVVFKGKKRR